MSWSAKRYQQQKASTVMQTGEVLAELESEADAGKSGLFLKDFRQFGFACEHFYKTYLFIQDMRLIT
jgi:hypothetical protein